MNTLSKRLLTLAVLTLSLTSSGCLLRRGLGKVQDHPTKKITLVETTDVYLTQVRSQFWECIDDSEKLVCTRSCDTGSDLVCHTLTLGAYSNLQ